MTRRIPRRMKTGAALRDSEHRFSIVFNKAPFALALTRMPEEVIVDANDRFLQLFEYQRGEVIGKTIMDLDIFTPKSQEFMKAELQSGGAVREYEVSRTSRFGKRLDLLINIGWIRVGEESHVLTTIQDISVRKQAQEALRRAHEELESRVRERTAELEREQGRRKFMSKKLVEILEKERRDMAAALHDEIGHVLTHVKMDLEHLKGRVGISLDDVQADIEAIQKRVGQSMDYIHGFSRTLRPSVLDDLGLASALQSMCREINERSTVACRLFAKDIPRNIEEEKALAIYRIVQEAATNCLKYARANNLYVNLTRKGETLLLTVEDDGDGFDCKAVETERQKKGQLGLMIMNERAMQAGGEFRVESQVGEGTQVLLEMPF